MSNHDPDQTIQKTEWTNSLLQDLFAALKGKRDDKIVRDFARELMDDKDLPISYLVQKAKEAVGAAQAERLDVLIRGRHAVEKSQKERVKPEKGVRALVRRFLR